MGNNKDIYFCISLVCYLLIITFNISLIIFIYLEKNLHEPMYIFLSNLFFSELIGSTSFYVKFMIDLRASTPVVSRSVCFIQVFLIYTYVFGEITILTVMAYDRYIAINWPLQYTIIISDRKIKKLIFLSWIYPCCMVALGTSLTARLSLCVPFIFIIYSYIKILILCWNNSRTHKHKAFQTCLPHLITLVLFLSSITFEVDLMHLYGLENRNF
ncbi:olfactory receptor 1493-like [Polypterus senegalus]|uniref:olfactory receptor 1493-like n=1 Tax=Polypterus senegalus TaxID=55291 RepID=UPI0019626605|nr:olfactory receptor 1493-like [Polypterus senegalus]